MYLFSKNPTRQVDISYCILFLIFIYSFISIFISHSRVCYADINNNAEKIKCGNQIEIQRLIDSHQFFSNELIFTLTNCGGVARKLADYLIFLKTGVGKKMDGVINYYFIKILINENLKENYAKFIEINNSMGNYRNSNIIYNISSYIYLTKTGYYSHSDLQISEFIKNMRYMMFYSNENLIDTYIEWISYVKRYISKREILYWRKILNKNICENLNRIEECSIKLEDEIRKIPKKSSKELLDGIKCFVIIFYKNKNYEFNICD